MLLKAKGQSLLMHIQQYMIKGFRIKRVISDGEASIKAVRPEVESLGVQLDILGHGSHVPHVESAIRHMKNKARSVVNSLSFSLASRFAAALVAFVVHTTNMVPKVNSVGHYPAHTAFTGHQPKAESLLRKKVGSHQTAGSHLLLLLPLDLDQRHMEERHQ